jgi:hypothetical protein
MLEQSFADKACGFKLPIFPNPSPVTFSTRSRTSFVWYALFCQLAAPLDQLDEPQRTAWCVKRLVSLVCLVCLVYLVESD